MKGLRHDKEGSSNITLRILPIREILLLLWTQILSKKSCWLEVPCTLYIVDYWKYIAIPKYSNLPNNGAESQYYKRVTTDVVNLCAARKSNWSRSGKKYSINEVQHEWDNNRVHGINQCLHQSVSWYEVKKKHFLGSLNNGQLCCPPWYTLIWKFQPIFLI